MAKKSAKKVAPKPPVLNAKLATPIYYQLAAHLKNEILVNSLPPGSPFHSNRQLVERHGVSLITVRRALEELVNENLLEQRHGAGTFLSDKVEKARAAARASEIRQDAILFSGWGLEALSGWDAMYFRDIYLGLKAAAVENNLRVLSDSDLESGPNLGTRAAKLGIRGAAILLGDRVQERAAELSGAGLKTLTINFKIPGLPSVLPQDYAGAREAVAHLVNQGHRRIAHLNSGEKSEHWTEVRRGFEDQIKADQLSLEENPVVLSRKREGSVLAGQDAAITALLLSQRPTAFFCGNDLMAIGALKELRSQHIRVPEEVSVIGFDNIEAAEICTPALTTMGVNRLSIGRRAVQILLDTSVQGDASFLEPVRMQLRESTAPAPVLATL